MAFEIKRGGPCFNCTKNWPNIPGNVQNNTPFCSIECKRKVIDKKFIAQLAAKIKENTYGTRIQQSETCE